MNKKRLKRLGFGNKLLLVFAVILIPALVWIIGEISKKGIKKTWSDNYKSILLIYFFELIIFWIGIILVYLSSRQLGFKLRLIGFLVGLIPILNLIALLKIISVTGREYRVEKAKNKLNERRASEKICKTKYPLLMVHGVFFRDFKHFNYWGRIPDELEKNGASIFYGNHQSALAVAGSAEELARRIKEILKETGCEKVNVIAHSKGGLDTKYAIAKLGMSDYVASLTTINTPHRGCEFADYLLDKAPVSLRDKVASGYNAALKAVGDENPSFIDAVTDLTASGCKKINEEIGDFDFKSHGVYTQSVGSWMKKATSGAFPLNMSYHLVKYFDGPNDGLVGEKSFEFGEKYTFLENKKNKRGISHGDMIDLNRENIDGFDVREFYVQLVSDLRKRGM
ncbi:triacylglycerol lipase [uncultured Eubacterium sp.]|uniref:esterase/lipase family protein n=1 Tax=uncultured Eubacterium sp. TaxID=165185 RepID=UPI0025983774|nr:triacylglycerol lipase [uncultured Eubacterium sp.]